MTHSISTEAGNGGRLIVVRGEFDSAAAPLLEDALRSECEADPGGKVTVDLAETDFVDSRTMSLLVAWTQHQRAAGGRLLVARPNDNVLRVFRQIGLDAELEIVSTLDDAPPQS